MKNLLIALLLLGVSLNCFGQTVISIYDADGNEIGQPDFMHQNSNRDVSIWRTDGRAIEVDWRLGNVTSNADGIVYTEPDCTGQKYMVLRGSYYPQLYDWIVGIPSDTHPVPLILINQELVSETINWKSTTSPSDDGGCKVVSSSGAVVPVTTIVPADYGFIITPTGDWGYAPPLKIKAVKLTTAGDALFCDGFESCPQQ